MSVLVAYSNTKFGNNTSFTYLVITPYMGDGGYQSNLKVSLSGTTDRAYTVIKMEP